MLDRLKIIEGLNALSKAMHENQCYACSHEFIKVTQEFGTNIIEDALKLLKEQEAEIAFLKEMQLQTIHNMSDEDIGNAVRNVLRL